MCIYWKKKCAYPGGPKSRRGARKAGTPEVIKIGPPRLRPRLKRKLPDSSPETSTVVAGPSNRAAVVLPRPSASSALRPSASSPSLAVAPLVPRPVSTVPEPQQFHIDRLRILLQKSNDNLERQSRQWQDNIAALEDQWATLRGSFESEVAQLRVENARLLRENEQLSAGRRA